MNIADVERSGGEKSEDQCVSSELPLPIELKADTIFLRCSALRSRGELVNHFLFRYRAEIGIEDWYANDSLQCYAPLETVYVKNSRKPFFLIEVRFPFPEELDRRKKVVFSSEHRPVDGKGENEEKSQAITPSKLLKVSKALLSLGETVKEYRGEPVLITRGLNNISVREERQKLEERESQRKREREPLPSQHEVKHKDTLTSFVPRAVRRRN